MAARQNLSGETFAGPVTALTPGIGDISTSVATTAFVSALVDGVTTVTTSGGTTPLTAAQFGTATWLISGTLTSNATLVVPASGAFTACNRTSGAYTVTIKTANGTGVVVPQGLSRNLICDGTNVLPEMTDLSGLIPALTALIATLPTTLPATSGQLWLDGGVLCMS